MPIFAVDRSTPTDGERLKLRLASFNDVAWESDIAVDALLGDGFEDLKVDDDAMTRLADVKWTEATRVEQQRGKKDQPNTFIASLRIHKADEGLNDTPVVAVHSKYWIVNHTGKRLRCVWREMK